MFGVACDDVMGGSFRSTFEESVVRLVPGERELLGGRYVDGNADEGFEQFAPAVGVEVEIRPIESTFRYTASTSSEMQGMTRPDAIRSTAFAGTLAGFRIAE